MPAKKRRKNKKPTKLQELRIARSLSLEDVAHDTGAFRSAISRWENGMAEPTRPFRDQYAACLGITKAELGAIVYGGDAP
jgi:transcriptional regulator with XRE-family HTH domain